MIFTFDLSEKKMSGPPLPDYIDISYRGEKICTGCGRYRLLTGCEECGIPQCNYCITDIIVKYEADAISLCTNCYGFCCYLCNAFSLSPEKNIKCWECDMPICGGCTRKWEDDDELIYREICNKCYNQH